ncbi:MAG TPA: hypothetical protein VFT42_07235 [Solirubrobacteraceae bacterium]|nr:hypothetical protein [Solirubrobacteraceae bacterium]
MADTTTTRKTNATKRSTAGKKAAATRRTNAARRNTRTTARSAQRSTTRAAKAAAPSRSSVQQAKTPVEVVQVYAEKAVVIPVGAALVARDNLVATVEDLRGRYSTRDKAQRTIESDLKKFERRGVRARKNVEREVKKARTRLERTLRQNRRRAERQVTSYRKDARLASARFENVVQTGVAAGAGAAQKVSERVSSIA